MRKTHHFEVRKNNRGISDYMIDIVLEYGDTIGDRIILGKKKTEKLISEIKHLDRELRRVSDKNGVAIVLENDSLVTTFQLHRKTNKMKVVR